MAKKQIKVNNIQDTIRIIELNIADSTRTITLEVLVESPDTYKAIANSKALIRELLKPSNAPDQDESKAHEAELLCNICEKLANQGEAIREVVENSITRKSWVELSEVYYMLPYETLLRLYREICNLVEKRIVDNMNKEVQNNGL